MESIQEKSKKQNKEFKDPLKEDMNEFIREVLKKREDRNHIELEKFRLMFDSMCLSNDHMIPDKKE